jgi:hypothetical protein
VQLRLLQEQQPVTAASWNKPVNLFCEAHRHPFHFASCGHSSIQSRPIQSRHTPSCLALVKFVVHAPCASVQADCTHQGVGMKCHTSIKPSSSKNSRGNVTMPKTGHRAWVKSALEIMPRAVASLMERGAVTSQSSLTPQSNFRYLGGGKWKE